MPWILARRGQRSRRRHGSSGGNMAEARNAAAVPRRSEDAEVDVGTCDPSATRLQDSSPSTLLFPHGGSRRVHRCSLLLSWAAFGTWTGCAAPSSSEWYLSTTDGETGNEILLPHDFSSCSEHLQRHDWNNNGSVEEWKYDYMRTANCAHSGEQFARVAGRSRPAAQSGIHVPTVIVPTISEELPKLPPFYFVLPVWDMVVSNRVRLFGTYDAQELDILMSIVRPGDTFVDIGANVGAVTVPLAAHVGREGVVFAFEPFRQIFQFLNANVATNGLANVHTFQRALSDPDCPRQVIAPAPTLEAAQNAGMHAVFKGASATPNEHVSEKRERMETIEVRTLDSFNLPQVDFIKIDVEGHSPRVIAGSSETIRRHRPVVWFEDGSPHPPDLFLEQDLGYWCTRFDPSVTTEDQYMCLPKELHAELQDRVNRGSGLVDVSQKEL
eukprot:TRINITY_DN62720_c0_g1_i1.p1 TRINITY_DN62720_c0_g1~~TRINITY_DN62720_c0_g1_i1.p1  ORF type:complete len:440 (+),score=60.98 TRINITY_DN62720_c0_g1_i1:58-1377(+)